MNVRIITLKLWGNYGSMLQAYALYQLCVKLGGCPMVVQMTHKPLQRLEISVSSVRSFIVGILSNGSSHKAFPPPFIRAHPIT